MTTILATRSGEARIKGEALIRTADRLLCQSWNERMWADGEPIDPSPTIDQAINGGYSRLEIEMLALQVAAERRPCGPAPSRDHLRA